MSYKDTLKKLENVYGRVSSNMADVLVEVELYEDLTKKSVTDINNLLKKLSIDNWRFYTTQPRLFFWVDHNNDDTMKSWTNFDTASCSISYPSPSSELSLFKKDIDEALLKVIRKSRLNLPFFIDKGVKTIKTITSLVTEDLRRDLIDIVAELDQVYSNILKLSSETEEISDSYREALDTLEQQAANEWFAEGYLKKGMAIRLYVCPASTHFYHEEVVDIVGDTVITTKEKYLGLLRLNSQATIPFADYDTIRKATWRAYNPGINIEKLVDPMRYVNDFERIHWGSET